MKTKSLALAALSFFALTACEKEPVTKPVDFSATTYQTLGTFDSTGKPNYLVGRDNISNDLTTFIRTTLPADTDLRTTNPDLLTTKAIADIPVTKANSEVFLTFVFQRAGAYNAIAYYTYPTATPPASAKDIKEIIYAFPSAGKGSKLTPGDKVKLGTFQPGVSIGFVLMQNAWDPTTRTLNNGAVHYASNDVLNPEVDPALKKHAVLVKYEPENLTLIGFEDLNRTTAQCDHDFNDVVLYATVKN